MAQSRQPSNGGQKLTEPHSRYLALVDRQLAEIRKAFVRIKRRRQNGAVTTHFGGHMDTMAIVGLYSTGPTDPNLKDWFPPCPVYFLGGPGTGKTAMITRFLPPTLGVRASRIQCTPEMTEKDVLGMEVVRRVKSPEGEEVVFFIILGPAFEQLVAFDEISRRNPTMDAAFLELLSEPEVSLKVVGRYRKGETTARGADDGGDETRVRWFPLPSLYYPTFSANPIELEGVYPLGEAFLDRIGMVVIPDHPTMDEKMEIARRNAQFQSITIEPVLTPEEALAIRRFIFETIRVPERTLAYIQRITEAIVPFPRSQRQIDHLYEDSADTGIVDAYRELWNPETKFLSIGGEPYSLSRLVRYGMSVRAALFLESTAKTMAFLRGKSAVRRDEVKHMARYVLPHRIFLTDVGRSLGERYFGSEHDLKEVIVDELLARVAAFP